MTGTQFLIEALKLYPMLDVLLTAYADTEAAITAINKIGLDHYLLKPWEPPEQRLYPVLDDLLAEWMARTRPPFEGIRVAGTALSASSYAVKDFLSRNLIPHSGSISIPTRPRVSSFNRQPTACRGCRSSCFKTARRWRRRRASSPRRSGCRHALSVPFTTSSSSAADRPGLRQRCMALPKVCGQSSWNDATGQAGTSSQIENYLGFPSGIRRRSRASRHRPGQAVWSRDRIGAGRHLHSPQRPLPCSCPLGRFGAELLRSARGVWHGSATTRGAGRG